MSYIVASKRDRLFDSIKESWERLRPYRKKREDHIREFVGSEYAGMRDVEYGEMVRSKRQTYVNLLSYAAETYAMILAANNPAVDVSTEYRHLHRFARIYKTGINNLIKEIRLNETLQECVVDAFFSMGIAKIYLADAGAAQLDGVDEYIDPGRPYVERISLDDWFHDVANSSWRRIRYCGDRYKVPFEKLQRDSIYDPAVVKTLSPDDSNDGESRSSEIGDNDKKDELEPSIWLMDVYLPFEGKVVTWPWATESPTKPLAVINWDSEQGGPYETLRFGDVPDNLMPVGIAGNISNLALVANSLLRRLVRQAGRSKIVGVTQNSEDATRLTNARDGEVVHAQNPDSVKEKKFGGIDGSNNAFYMQVADLFSKYGGNLDAMSGMGPQADTLGQERLVYGQMNQRVAKLVDSVKLFTERIVRKLGSMMWQDEVLSIPGTYKPPGTEVELQSDWAPGEREGQFEQYAFSIDPYSMAYRSPADRAANLERILTQVIGPAAPLIQQQGGVVDWREVVDVLAELHDLPRLRNMIKFDLPTEASSQEAPAGGLGQPTTREYVRKSAGGNGESQQQQMMQAMMQGAASDVGE